MAIVQFILTLFCTVGFCLGLRIVTDKGQVLYFLRKPFEGLQDKINYHAELRKDFGSNYCGKVNINLLKIQNYITKPLIMCITCLASVWGVTWFLLLNGASIDLIKFMVLNSFMAAFIQTFIWNLYEKYL